MVTKLERSKGAQKNPRHTNTSYSSQLPLQIKNRKNACSYHYNAQPIFESETAILLVITNSSSNQKYVIKILKEYEDLRYHMATPRARLHCQFEALVQNRRFTPDVYLGLARLYSSPLDKNEVHIGEIIKEPAKNKLDKDADYVLVMKYLPVDRRLDCLLKVTHDLTFVSYIDLLSDTIAQMHNISYTRHNEYCTIDVHWGNCEQLRQKLDHNLPFLQIVLNVVASEQPSLHDHMKDVFDHLRKLMQRTFDLQEFRDCFTERQRQRRIQHCHGDLKATNIWILPSKQDNGQSSLEQVKILDAIDFNPAYCHIDILADMAMLAVDIEAGVSYKAAQRFIHRYLKQTGQSDKATKTVLPYYLIEKAMIGVIVCFVYDKLPKQVGLRYLLVAQKHMTELKHREQLMALKEAPMKIVKKHILPYISSVKQRIVGVQQSHNPDVNAIPL